MIPCIENRKEAHGIGCRANRVDCNNSSKIAIWPTSLNKNVKDPQSEMSCALQFSSTNRNVATPALFAEKIVSVS